MKIAIASRDDSHLHGFYSKVEGLINAGNKIGKNQYVRSGDGSEQYDVVINHEPYGYLGIQDLKGPTGIGKKLTIVWEWDSHRATLKNEAGGEGSNKFQVLFRAHATFYRGDGIDPRPYTTYWMPPAVDETVFKRIPSIEREFDITWCGQLRHFPEMKILKKHFNMNYLLGGLPYKEYVEEMNKGKLILNAPLNHETNKRVMEAMAIGPALMSWGPDYSLIATPDKHFICYDSMGKKEDGKEFAKRLVRKVKYYLARPDELDKIQKAGRELIEERFTFEKQAERIDKIVAMHT